MSTAGLSTVFLFCSTFLSEPSRVHTGIKEQGSRMMWMLLQAGYMVFWPLLGTHTRAQHGPRAPEMWLTLGLWREANPVWALTLAGWPWASDPIFLTFCFLDCETGGAGSGYHAGDECCYMWQYMGQYSARGDGSLRRGYQCIYWLNDIDFLIIFWRRSGACNELSRTGGLKEQNCILSHIWSPEVQYQGVCRPGSLWRPQWRLLPASSSFQGLPSAPGLGEHPFGPCLSLHLVFSSGCSQDPPKWCSKGPSTWSRKTSFSQHG